MADDAFPDRAVAQATPEPFVSSTGDLWWHVEAIVSRHITPITGRVTYGVKFKGYDESENIFIDEATLLENVPELIAQYEHDHHRSVAKTQQRRSSFHKRN
ncbi:hypothetical protein VaNZ11_005378 [Volvox africanus]|uniref:Chromo domain-containing protein n=1 Tax=Volvox africanus TaxID=51714 RepID=A0ABQ5RYK3_9CHLO|nr:hypothetical protein VaNZ11_005378 [Volvox africanus]